MTPLSILHALAAARIAVVGDLMLDTHVYGRVHRISEEAPVPILHVRNERSALGGAGNVAANAASLGAVARLLGVIGADAAGNSIARLLQEDLPTVEPALVVDPSRPTILKTRYLGGQQQIMRVDREVTAPLNAALAAQVREELPSLAHDHPVIVVSDYGKGLITDELLSELFSAAAAAGRFTIVDPKRRDFADYRGASLITPNRKELTLATGLPCETDEEAQIAAEVAMAASGAWILLTRSEKGMTLFRPDAPPFHLPTQAREVFDVSGAGDTVVAALACALAGGLPIERALRIANACAGVVVAKIGTATVRPEELLAALEEENAAPTRRATLRAGAAASRREAQALRADWGAHGLTVGFTNGCFDLLHPGHVSLIAQAAEACDRLIVAINSDDSVRRLKGPTRPLQNEAARARVLSAIKGVDLVTVFDEETPLELIQLLQPDLLVKGADYTEDQVVGAEIVKARGGKVLLASLIEGQSTTAIAARAKLEPQMDQRKADS